MKRRTFHPTHPFTKINVTPMIDVVMCLIVFYLMVGNLAASQRGRVNLPRTHEGLTEPAQDLLIVGIVPDPEGENRARIFVDGVSVSRTMLSAVVRDRLAERPRLVVQVRAARDLPYGEVAPVLRACARAGVTSVRLATERAGEGRG